LVRFLSIERERRTTTDSERRGKIQIRYKSPFNSETFSPSSPQGRWYVPTFLECGLLLVEHSLPKKREYILYAPLTEEQSELYQSILDKDIHRFLENKHLSKASSTGTLTPRKRKSESPDEDDESGRSTPTTRSGLSTPMSRTSSSRSMRKRLKTSYREMTDAQWFEAMEKAEKEQFKDDYTPSPEVQKLTSTTRISQIPFLTVDTRKIFRQSKFTKYDYATSKSSESSIFI
jgi:hypothetical protein